MEKRRIIKTEHEYFSPYNRYGTVSSGLKWMPLSKDEKFEHEVFIVQFEPEVPQVYINIMDMKSFM